MLLALITGQRIQTLHSLDLTFMNIENDHVNIDIHEILKTSKPGNHLPPLFFPVFVEEQRLCIVTVLKEYIQRTEHVLLHIRNLIINQQYQL